MLKLLFIQLLFWPLYLSAAVDKAISDSNYIAPDPVSMGGIMNMIFGLLFVIVLILVLAWLMRKYGRLPTHNQVDMSVLGGLSLGARDRAVLVQVEGQRVLLGVSPGRISTLLVLTDESTPSIKEAPSNTSKFNQQLSQAIEQQS